MQVDNLAQTLTDEEKRYLKPLNMLRARVRVRDMSTLDIVMNDEEAAAADKARVDQQQRDQQQRDEMVTANIRKVQRKGRIFLDWLRNQRGSTAVMPYSARAREGAPVAAPIAWEELDKYEGGNHFTIRDADELIERAGSKLLKGWGQAKQALPNA